MAAVVFLVSLQDTQNYSGVLFLHFSPTGSMRQGIRGYDVVEGDGDKIYRRKENCR